MTIGPCQAIGSRSGCPETSRKRTPSSPAWTLTLVAGVEHDERAVADLVAHQRFLAVDLSLAQRSERLGSVGEVAGALEDVSEGLAVDPRP